MILPEHALHVTENLVTQKYFKTGQSFSFFFLGSRNYENHGTFQNFGKIRFFLEIQFFPKKLKNPKSFQISEMCHKMAKFSQYRSVFSPIGRESMNLQESQVKGFLEFFTCISR